MCECDLHVGRVNMDVGCDNMCVESFVCVKGLNMCAHLHTNVHMLIFMSAHIFYS